VLREILGNRPDVTTRAAACESSVAAEFEGARRDSRSRCSASGQLSGPFVDQLFCLSEAVIRQHVRPADRGASSRLASERLPRRGQRSASMTGAAHADEVRRCRHRAAPVAWGRSV